MTNVQSAPFDLRLEFADPLRRRLMNAFRRPLERALGLDDLARRYARARQGDGDFVSRSLASLNVEYDVTADELARIPASGPLIVIANHPFGGLDGLVLASLVRRVRTDAKLIANSILHRIPELRGDLIAVNPYGGKEAARSNVAGLRRSVAHVKGGGCLIIFPGGEVSHLSLKDRRVVDPPWSQTLARLVRLTDACVLPVYLHGRNSTAFNLMGLFHPLVRTAMLPRELLRKEHSRIELEVGTPIPCKKLESIPSDDDLTAYLRLRTHVLRMRRADRTCPAAKAPVQRTAALVAAARGPGLLAGEIGRLPTQSRLLDTPEYAVYIAGAGQIPEVLHEIGRLREITFRATHEGTGKSLDLDDFDRSYLHLFCWQKLKGEIVGAYRIGQTDLLFQQGGVEALYTRTLWEYDEKLIHQIGPALELGRSFVREEYQRTYAPLLLLWKGIGAFVAANPRYHVLFGPVSINNQYQSMSRQLIMSFLRATASSHLAGLIRASNPPRLGPMRDRSLAACSTVVRDIEEVSDLVQEIESDRKGVPVLLRQYLKLSGRILGFNVDRGFGDVLDGLILVDLHQTDPRLVERFCGKEYAATLTVVSADAIRRKRPG